MDPAPLTEFHTCDACGCHVPVEHGFVVMRKKVSRLVDDLWKTRQALKDCRRQKGAAQQTTPA